MFMLVVVFTTQAPTEVMRERLSLTPRAESPRTLACLRLCEDDDESDRHTKKLLGIQGDEHQTSPPEHTTSPGLSQIEITRPKLNKSELGYGTEAADAITTPGCMAGEPVSHDHSLQHQSQKRGREPKASRSR